MYIPDEVGRKRHLPPVSVTQSSAAPPSSDSRRTWMPRGEADSSVGFCFDEAWEAKNTLPLNLPTKDRDRLTRIVRFGFPCATKEKGERMAAPSRESVSAKTPVADSCANCTAAGRNSCSFPW